MFTIDLLKGQGIPVKSRPENAAIVATIFAVPVIIAIVMFGYYLRTRIVISIQKQRIINYGAKINELSDAVNLKRTFEKEKNIIDNSLAEVKFVIGRHVQWSPILVTLVENIPTSVVLTELEVKQSAVKRKIPQKSDPKKMIDIKVPKRTLQISVSGSPSSDCDKAVKDFRNRLRSSALLEPKLEAIRVSQGVGTLEKREMISYQIDCIFEPAL